jgi:hypothetical protein
MYSDKVIKNLSEKYSIDSNKIRQALSNIISKKVVFYGICGKVASGKDTVCMLTQDLLAQKYPDSIKVSCGCVVREEVSLIIDRIKSRRIEGLAEELNVPQENLDTLISVMQNDSSYNTDDFSTYIHSLYMKDALQYWGTTVRRTQDELYWAKISARRIIENLAAGYSVFISDAKYACEIEIMLDFGAFVTFLEASEAVRVKRLIARDGYRPDRSVLQHPGELSIDTISKNRYNLVVSTETNMASAIVRHILLKSKQK